MSSPTPSGGSIITPQNLEDYLLFVLPIAVGLAGFNWGGALPGVGGFLVAAILGSFAKFLVGLGQNPHVTNWEDWIPAVVIGLTSLATSFSSNPQFAIYGFYLALIVKALPIFQQGFNIEDALLFIGAVLAAVAQASNQPTVSAGALVLGLVGKTIPSMATNGKPQNLRISVGKA